MSDDERNANETNTRGADWEVVSLTASTYAATPGPQVFDSDEQQKNQEFNNTEQDCTEAMLMSKHFVVPLEKPEHFPCEPYCSESYNEQNRINEEFKEPHKFKKDKGKIDSDRELFDTGLTLSDQSMKFGDGKQKEDLKTLEKEHALFLPPNYGNFDEEADMILSMVHDDVSDLTESENLFPDNHDYLSRQIHDCKSNEEHENERCESHEAWWKKRAFFLYNHAKGTNSFWPIFVVVAMAGLVILGQRLRREKSYFQLFKWKFSGTDEKVDRMAGPMGRFKVLMSGNNRGGSMREGLHPTF